MMISSGFAISNESQPSSFRAQETFDSHAHQADIYSLGVVLLEALTRRAPEHANLHPEVTPSEQSSSLEVAAKTYASARSRIARVLVDEAEAESGRTIPSGLRAIIEHALDPVPSHRYRCAGDFAEDLDRWRSNRPLAFAPAPFWRHTLPNCLRRRQRLLLVVAASLSLVRRLPTTLMMVVAARRTQADIARNKLNRHWDAVDAYPFRPMTSNWLEDSSRSSTFFRLTDPGDSRALELASHALEDFGLFGAGDWHRGGTLNYLPRADREDLELWLMEQAYRYCLALAERPNSSHDWERARNLLGRLDEANLLPAFAALAGRLNTQLHSGGSTATGSRLAEIQLDRVFGSAPHETLNWLSEYLLGVAAKCEFDVSEDQAHRSADDPRILGSQVRRPTIRGRQSAANALEHFRKFLVIRPDSYWGNYCAAGVCYVLGAFAESAQYLERCLAIRPNNAAVRGQRAACLAWLARYSEAMEECDQAIDQAPDLPEVYRTRAFIRAVSGRTSNLAADVQRFEFLSRLFPRQFLENVSSLETSDLELTPARIQNRVDELSNGLGVHGTLASSTDRSNGDAQFLAVDPGELSVRLVLASRILDSGDRELAACEYAKILTLDPHHVPARISRALEEIEDERFGQALRDLDVVLEHPHLMEYLTRNPSLLRALVQASRRLLLGGRVQEGQSLAQERSSSPTHCISSEAPPILTSRVPMLFPA